MKMDLNAEDSPPLAWNKWSIVAGHESEEDRSGVSLEVPSWTKRKRSSCPELVLGLSCSPEDSVESQGSTLSAEPETSLCLGQSNDPNMGMHLRLGLPSQEEEEEEEEQDAPRTSDTSSSKPYPSVANPNPSFNPNPNPNLNPIPSPSTSFDRSEERQRKRHAIALVQDKRVHGGCLAMGGIGPDLFRDLVHGNNHFTGEYQKRGGLPFPQLKRPAPAPGFSLGSLNDNNNGRKPMIPSDVLVPHYMQKPKEEEEEKGEKGVGSPLSAPRLESRVHGATHLSFLSQIIAYEDCPEQAKRSSVTFEDYLRQVRASQDTLKDYPKLARSLPTNFGCFPQSLTRASPPIFKFYPVLDKASQTAFEDRRHLEQEKPSQTETSKDYFPFTLEKASRMMED